MGGMPITNGMEGIVDMGAQQVLPASINTRDGDGTSIPSVNLPAVGGGGTNGNMSRDGSKKQLTAEERELRQKKKEAKAKRRAQKEAARLEKLKSEQANMVYSDEAGTGEQAENTLNGTGPAVVQHAEILQTTLSIPMMTSR